MLMFDMLSVCAGAGAASQLALSLHRRVSRVTTKTNFEFGISVLRPTNALYKEENLKLFQKGCQLNPDLDISRVLEVINKIKP